MELPTTKELKRLANACRKAGIKSLKCEGFEFTLSEYAPESKRAAKQAPLISGAMKSVIDQDFETEALTQDQLLNWSVNTGAPDEEQEA